MARAKFLTIEEAMRVLRIGRTAAYAGAKRYRQTGGAEGLPVIVVCGSLRVPVAKLEEMAGGPIDLDDLAAPIASLDAKRAEKRSNPAPEPTASSPRATKRPVAADDQSQRPLPFTG
jgi:hypothetical protein